MSRDTDEHYRLMTEGPVAPLIVRLAIPTTLSMLVTSAYNLVDTAFVGTLGTSASGAVGVVFGFMSIIQAFGFLFGQGAGSIVARLLGAHDTRGADLAASTGVALSLATGVVMAVAGTVWLPTPVTLMGATPTIAPFAQDYVRLILIAAPIMCADFTMNQILRYEGKAALGMVALMCGCALNVALDALFMFHLNMGIAGAGLSTAVSELVSFCILLAMFLTGRSVTHLSPANVTLAPRLVLDILGTGLPSLIRQGLNSVNTMLLNLAAAPFGDAAVAAMSIVGRIVFFAFSIALGICQGFQPVASFNYGARRFARVKAATRAVTIISQAVTLCMVAVLVVFTDDLIRIFRDDAAVVAIGERALRLQALSLILIAPTVVCEMLYQSTGHKLGASTLSLMRSGLLSIPLIVVMPRLRGIAGLQEAQAIANVLMFPPAMAFLAHFMKTLPKDDDSGPAATQ